MRYWQQDIQIQKNVLHWYFQEMQKNGGIIEIAMADIQQMQMNPKKEP